LLRPRPALRWLSLGFGAAGLLAQTIFLAVRRPPLAWQFGWMLFLAWILAVFYLYGSLHHRRLAWGVFVLPLILSLVGIATFLGPPPAGVEARPEMRGEVPAYWGWTHAALLLMAAVGVCVGFLASLMYLFQAYRLRAKLPPGKGLKLLSLERLEAMNRRAVNLAFPLLTAGMLLGAILMTQVADQLAGWSDPRVLSTLVLWLTFVVLLALRYGYHLRGRPAAVLTIVAFVLLLCCITLSHPVGQGVAR
jgi:ABC-type transport system involved in cytochrome c biogenesis permease subunit